MLIPAGTCWMESDNPVNANDSNIYGPVCFFSLVLDILYSAVELRDWRTTKA